jgi:hypothetical protein
MVDTLVKLRKPALTLGSWEQINILRDPYKSIHTRKYEPVDAKDVVNNIRESADRLSENIRLYPTGVNPSVSISYSNSGGGSRLHSIRGIDQSTNPYKVGKAGAFRSPMYRLEDLLPLSRQKRPNTDVSAGFKPQYQAKSLQEFTIDFQPIKTAVHTKVAHNIQGHIENTYSGNHILDPLTYHAITQLKGANTQDAAYTTDAQRYLQDPNNTSCSSSKSNSNYISSAYQDVFLGTKKIDQFTPIQQTAKNTNMILLESITPEIQLERNEPLSVATTNLCSSLMNYREVQHDEINLERNTPITHASTSVCASNPADPIKWSPLLKETNPTVQASVNKAVKFGNGYFDQRDIVDRRPKCQSNVNYSSKANRTEKMNDDMTPSLRNTIKTVSRRS